MSSPPVTGNNDLDAYLYNLQLGVDAVAPLGSSLVAVEEINNTYYPEQYIQIRYADSLTGTNISTDQTNKKFYGVYNSITTTASNNPADYTWYEVEDTFGIDKFLFFTVIRGRNLKLFIGTTAPTVSWVEVPTTYIDLDVVSDGFIDNTDFKDTFEPVKLVTGLPDAFTYNGPTVVYDVTTNKLYRWLDGQWYSNVLAADLEGTLALSNFSNSLRPVEVVSVLPSSGNFLGRTVVLTTDGKLYRYTDTGWSAAVPTSDLSGQIVSTQITDNAITTDKIAANAVTAGTISAGAITSDKLAANSVIAGKIAAGAIDATKVTTGELITLSAQIKDAIITDAKILDASITNAKIANATITGAKIADATITGAKITDASITTAKIGDAQVNTLQIAGNAVNVISSAFSNGGVNLPYSGDFVTTSYIDLQSISIQANGTQPVLLTMGFYFVNTGPFTGGGSGIRILRNGTEIYVGQQSIGFANNFGIFFQDNPASGLVTYTLQMRAQPFYASGISQVVIRGTAYNRIMTAVLVKR